jgi:hypothetical protein
MSDPSWDALSTPGKAWVEGAYSSVVLRVYLIRPLNSEPLDEGKRDFSTTILLSHFQLHGFHCPIKSVRRDDKE